MTEHITHYSPDGGEGLLAIVIRAEYAPPGVTFVTEPTNGLQVGVLNRPEGDVAKAHYHPPAGRLVELTQEVLFVRSGAIRVTVYSSAGEDMGSKTLGAGDAVVLLRGGHEVKFLEPSVVLEVKQGPHLGDRDKRYYNS